MSELFLAFLSQHDDAAWLRAVDRLEPSIHEVDRAATRIWFHLFPLALQQAMDGPDAEALARRITLAGRWRLADQIDYSHAFLYGHQYWPEARQAILEYSNSPRGPGSLDLAAQVQEVARHVAEASRADVAVVTGIAAVALRTLQQVGGGPLASSPGDTVGAGLFDGRSADEILERRRQDLGGGLLALLRARRQSTVTFNERYAGACFPLIHSQHLTTAAAGDRRAFRAADPRCSEGPIPVQCRSCSCGTCWVGILNGADRLSAMDAKERAKLAEAGVDTADTAGGAAVIRLACMTQAFGPVSIVIPPWNGLLGRMRPPR